MRDVDIVDLRDSGRLHRIWSMKHKNAIHKYLSKIGKDGGDVTHKKYGVDHYRKIAKKRWNKAKSGDNSQV